MVLNRWVIYKTLIAHQSTQYDWRVEAAEKVGEIYLRTMIECIDILNAVDQMTILGGNTYQNYYYNWNETVNLYTLMHEKVHVIKEKKKIKIVDGSSLMPLLTLLRQNQT